MKRERERERWREKAVNKYQLYQQTRQNPNAIDPAYIIYP